MKNDLNLNQVDVLGNLLAQIADLQKQAEAIKDSIKDAATSGGAKVVEGNLFKATVVEANRKTTDWKAIAKVCNIPEDIIIANTSTNNNCKIAATELEKKVKKLLKTKVPKGCNCWTKSLKLGSDGNQSN